MRTKALFSIFAMAMYSTQVFASELPSKPTQADHPSSAIYEYQVAKESIKLNGRQVDVFLPKSEVPTDNKFPVVVFGHGQAIGVEGYELTFRHLAQKGIAVIHPTYDSGFFDQDWRRMAKDFNDLTSATVKKYETQMNPNQIMYSGHSKGAYIALMAAGAPQNQNSVRALVLFAPAGFDSEYLKAMNPDIPVTLAWSDGDTIIKQSLITEIYSKLPSRNKQWILVKSYDSLKADHYYPMSKSFFFGGRDGESAYHYFVSWKWLVGAVWDIQADSKITNTYIYGAETGSTGLSRLQHVIQRNW